MNLFLLLEKFSVHLQTLNEGSFFLFLFIRLKESEIADVAQLARAADL